MAQNLKEEPSLQALHPGYPLLLKNCYWTCHIRHSAVQGSDTTESNLKASSINQKIIYK